MASFGQKTSAPRPLDAALADPEGFIARRRRPGMDPRDRALAEARHPLDARAKPLSELREGDAERFVVEQDAYLHDLEDLATRYEIRDLATGRRFAGRVGREDLVAGVLGPIAVALTTSDVVQVLIRRIRAEVVAGNLDTAVALLRGLPPSHLVFLHTIGMLSLLPPAVVVSHLERHDPTRYWSAVVLASAVAEAERRHAGLLALRPSRTKSPSTCRRTPSTT